MTQEFAFSLNNDCLIILNVHKAKIQNIFPQIKSFVRLTRKRSANSNRAIFQLILIGQLIFNFLILVGQLKKSKVK